MYHGAGAALILNVASRPNTQLMFNLAYVIGDHPEFALAQAGYNQAEQIDGQQPIWIRMFRRTKQFLRKPPVLILSDGTKIDSAKVGKERVKEVWDALDSSERITVVAVKS